MANAASSRAPTSRFAMSFGRVTRNRNRRINQEGAIESRAASRFVGCAKGPLLILGPDSHVTRNRFTMERLGQDYLDVREIQRRLSRIPTNRQAEMPRI